MKKMYSAALTSVLAISLLAACGTSNPPSTTPAAPAPAAPKAEKIELSLGHATAATENSHYQQGALKFKEEIEKATDGQVTVKIHPNAELGGEREMIEAVQIGTLDMVFTSTGPLGNFASKSNAFDFPFLFKDREHAYKALDGEPGDIVNKQLEESGLKNLAWMENGFRNMTNNKRAIVKPEDLKGIKIRTMENKVHMESFTTFGADPTPMSFAELFTAMQQGVVDGQENPLGVIIPNKFFEVQKHLTMSGHFYSPAPLLINKGMFDKMSPELQQKILDAAKVAKDFERQFLIQKDEEFLKIAKEQGMQVVEKDQFDYDAFFNASQSVYEKMGKDFAELHEKIKAVQ